MRYSEIVVNINKKYEAAQQAMAQIELSDEAEVIAWAQGVKEWRQALAREKGEDPRGREAARRVPACVRPRERESTRTRPPTRSWRARTGRRQRRSADVAWRERLLALDARDAIDGLRASSRRKCSPSTGTSKRRGTRRSQKLVNRIYYSEIERWRRARQEAEEANRPLPERLPRCRCAR